MRVVVTGANSAVGLAILRCGRAQWATITLVPAVRSDRGAERVRQLLGGVNGVVQVSYDDPGGLSTAFNGASAVVHLAGVLVERPGSTYEQANVGSTRGVVEAARRSAVEKLVLVSAIGASETSANRYWRTKGQAEGLVRASGLSYTVLRAPLLLGSGTEGAAALKRHASQRRALLIGGGRNLQQLDLVGPVSLSEREIVERAAHLLGGDVRVWSIPKRWASLTLALLRRTGRPGLSPDALDVITADTSLDPRPAASELGIQLTGIDEMIERSLASSVTPWHG
jgi:uncharacterized protein YbjT (DUF2867 family)